MKDTRMRSHSGGLIFLVGLYLDQFTEILNNATYRINLSFKHVSFFSKLAALILSFFLSDT